MKAYSYIRWSSAKQSSGDSLRRQTEQAESYAKRHGLTLDVSTYQDHGISAFKGKNVLEGKLGSFLRALDEGRVETPCYLLVEHLDRISRADINDAAKLFLDITGRGVTIVTLQNEQVFSKASISKNWTELIIVLASLANAHEESRKKSDRLVKVFANKRELRKQGYVHGACPSWLQVVEKNGKRQYQPIPWKVKVVKRIYELAIAGNGIVKITQLLNEANTPLIGRSKGEKWREGNVAALLRQEAVTGAFRQTFGDVRIPDYYPQIISPKDWSACQSAMKGRRNRSGGFNQGTSNLFSGIFRCAYCKSTFKFLSQHKDPWLLCRGRALKLCSCRSFRYGPVESDLLSYLIQHAHRDLHAHKMDASVSSRKRELQQEIIAKQSDVERLVAALTSSKTKPGALVDAMDTAQEELDKLQAELAELNTNPRSEQQIKDDVELFYKLTVEPTKELRLEVQTALRRQIKLIEIAPYIDEQPKQVQKEFKIDKPLKLDPHQIMHMVRITYSDGSTAFTDVLGWNQRTRLSKQRD